MEIAMPLGLRSNNYTAIVKAPVHAANVISSKASPDSQVMFSVQQAASKSKLQDALRYVPIDSP